MRGERLAAIDRSEAWCKILEGLTTTSGTFMALRLDPFNGLLPAK